jgi:hypothetical protein
MAYWTARPSPGAVAPTDNPAQDTDTGGHDALSDVSNPSDLRLDSESDLPLAHDSMVPVGDEPVGRTGPGSDEGPTPAAAAHRGAVHDGDDPEAAEECLVIPVVKERAYRHVDAFAAHLKGPPPAGAPI